MVNSKKVPTTQIEQIAGFLNTIGSCLWIFLAQKMPTVRKLHIPGLWSSRNLVYPEFGFSGTRPHLISRYSLFFLRSWAKAFQNIWIDEIVSNLFSLKNCQTFLSFLRFARKLSIHEVQSSLKKENSLSCSS